jgi:hypothetical protein
MEDIFDLVSEVLNFFLQFGSGVHFDIISIDAILIFIE